MVRTRTPTRLDRYEVVGRLATGGMAEVLLARIRGPHGFERPVVVKRILSHLALEQSMVELFLDEARIISNLRHPNLIHVHELGRDKDELFIVMEYLEGESVAGLCRRLAVRREQLEPVLAAHIVAEACAGLHAAHEATGADGRPLALVHRDVSPQNVFVTYAGAIHVIDFGIATTADRVSRTEAGVVRGKFEYLAPEQLRSEPIDRRVDIFGLGILLLEVASGRRAFKRSSHAATMTAILSEPAPKLTALRPDAPAELDAICARALSKEPEDRFQTAAEMRRELLAFIRKRTQEDTAEKLGALMRNLFPDRIARKTEMLQRVRQGAELAEIPQAEVDIEIDLPTAVDPRTSFSQSISKHPLTPQPAPRRRRAPLYVLALSLVLVVGVLGVTARAWRERRSAQAVAPPMVQPAAVQAIEEGAVASDPLPLVTEADAGHAERKARHGIAPRPSTAGGPSRSLTTGGRPSQNLSTKPGASASAGPALW
jgi:serine/threonine-protein kinase